MRLSLVALLCLAVLPVVYSEVLYDPNAPLGSKANPYPSEDEEEDGADDQDADDKGEDEEYAKVLKHYEDTGENDKLDKNQMRDLHAKLDKNGDGKLHMDEIHEHAMEVHKKHAREEIAEMMPELESTKEGYLSLEQFTKEMEGEYAKDHKEDPALVKRLMASEIAKFKAADENGDGKLETHELASLHMPKTNPAVLELHTKDEMTRWDTDKDGSLSKAEWIAADKKEHPHHTPEDHDPAENFEKLDANHDGKLDMDELRHWESGRHHTELAVQELHRIADQDKDGHLTPEELAAAAEKLETIAIEKQVAILQWAQHHDEM